MCKYCLHKVRWGALGQRISTVGVPVVTEHVREDGCYHLLGIGPRASM